MNKRRGHEEAVVVVRAPFRPNVPLIRESLVKYYGSATPRPVEVSAPSAPPPSAPPSAKAL